MVLFSGSWDFLRRNECRRRHGESGGYRGTTTADWQAQERPIGCAEVRAEHCRRVTALLGSPDSPLSSVVNLRADVQSSLRPARTAQS